MFHISRRRMRRARKNRTILPFTNTENGKKKEEGDLKGTGITLKKKTEKKAGSIWGESYSRKRPRTIAKSSKCDAVLFRNGIGNFILATPFIRNLNNPEILIPKGDFRIEAIRSISPWPVFGIDKVGMKSLNRYDRAFALWCWPREWGTGNNKIYFQPDPNWGKGEHEADTYLNILPNATKLAPKIRTERAWTLHTGANEKLIAFCNGCGAETDYKRWPPERWADLAERIIDSHPDTQFLFVGNASEAIYGEAVVDRVGLRCWNLAGKLSFAQSADALLQSDLMVTTDTALMHAADALGVRIIALFGPTNWAKNYPFGGNAVRIQASSGGCPHFPCLHKPAMGQCRYSKCMETISVGQVYESVCNEI